MKRPGDLICWLVLCWCAWGCSTDLPTYPRITDWGGKRVDLYGEVADPDGAPVAGARVQIVTRMLPHNPPESVGEAHTATDGTFVIPDIQAGAVRYVVVRSGSSALTFDRHIEVGARGHVSLGRYIIGPQRNVKMRLRCLPFDGAPPRPEVSLQVRQVPTNELIVENYPVSEPSPDRSGPATPGRGHYVPSLSLEETNLYSAFRLPIGPNIVEISGSCGDRVTTVEVPATGAAIIELDLRAVHDVSGQAT